MADFIIFGTILLSYYQQSKGLWSIWYSDPLQVHVITILRDLQVSLGLIFQFSYQHKVTWCGLCETNRVPQHRIKICSADIICINKMIFFKLHKYIKNILRINNENEFLHNFINIIIRIKKKMIFFKLQKYYLKNKA